MVLPLLLALGGLLREGRPLSTLLQGAPDFIAADKGVKRVLVTGWGRLAGLLSDSGSPQVVVGRKGWLYFRPALNSALGAGRMEPDEMTRLADALAAMADRLALRGTRLVLLIAPDKASVYPQYLPCYILPGSTGLTDRVRLLTLLKERGVLAPDLFSLFQASGAPLYLQTDTHWNARGAWLAFDALFRSAGLNSPWQFLPEDFIIPVKAPGDLVPLYLPGVADAQQDWLPDLPRGYASVRPLRSLDDLLIQTTSPSGGPTVYAARDSFGRALFPYLANASSELVFTRDYAGFERRAAGYDLAVILIAERNLGELAGKLGAD